LLIAERESEKIFGRDHPRFAAAKLNRAILDFVLRGARNDLNAIRASATDAKVPDFIEFIVKDMPQHQTPMRGGLRWLDMHAYKKKGKSFVDLDEKSRLEIVDEIAFPQKAAPEVTQGVAFFSLMRNLTATGFYTSKIGVEDVGYKGNQPNQWNGVPDDVLKQYGVAYTEKENKECVKYQ